MLIRASTPWLCILYNSDFIIFSSMTSFYVPCVLMIVLYWRTFRAISARARKMAGSAARRRKSIEVATASRSIQTLLQSSSESPTDRQTYRPHYTMHAIWPNNSTNSVLFASIEVTTASRSVQPLLQGSSESPTGHTDHRIYHTRASVGRIYTIHAMRPSTNSVTLGLSRFYAGMLISRWR